MDQERSLQPSSPGTSNSDWLVENSSWIEKSTESNFGLGRVYVVCMGSRLEHTRDFLEKNGISGRVSILRAFTPDQFDMNELIDLKILSAGFSRKGGQTKYERSVFIFLSHLACWLDAQRCQAGPILVLEDDLACVDEREHVANLIALAHSHSWDLLYLSYCHAKQSSSRPVTDELIELKGQLCANAYALTKSALNSLLDSAFPIGKELDVYMRNHAEAENLVALGARSLLFQQDRSVVKSSFGRRRIVSSPAWHPALRQKLISRAHSLLTFSGGAGYDEAIYLIDRHRQGELPQEEQGHLLIRVWERLERIKPTREIQ